MEAKNTTTISKNIYNLIILDESGSMSAIAYEAVSAMNETFNSIRKAQKENPSNNYFVSLVVFEGSGIGGVRIVRDRVPVVSVKDVNFREYQPGGCTPLYDAMGVSINHLSSLVMEDDPVLVTIITDGMENSSEEYSGLAIRKIVEEKRAKGWTFAYIGANQDSVEVASELMINNALNFDADKSGMRKMSKKLERAMMNYNTVCCSMEASERSAFDELFSSDEN